MLNMLLYVIIIKNSYNNNNNNNNNNVQKKKSLLPMAQWLTYQRRSGSVLNVPKKEKKRRGDVAHVRGTKNKIKPLT